METQQRTRLKKVFLQTFGCQMNERDSEAVLGLLIEKGFEPVSSPEESDLLLYNTCSVRNHAEQKVFGRMGHFKHLKAARPGHGASISDPLRVSIMY